MERLPKEDGGFPVRGRNDPAGRQYHSLQQDDLDALCGIIFVEQQFTAKILYHFLNVSMSILASFCVGICFVVSLYLFYSYHPWNWLSWYRRMQCQNKKRYYMGGL